METCAGNAYTKGEQKARSTSPGSTEPAISPCMDALEMLVGHQEREDIILMAVINKLTPQEALFQSS